MEFYFRRTFLFCVTLLLVCSTLTTPKILAQDVEQTNNVMTVGEMCGGCVTKITTRFDGIEGIAKVECDIKLQKVTIVPADGYSLSARGIWEIMEEIGKTPKKMVCPSGTFTTKPEN